MKNSSKYHFLEYLWWLFAIPIYGTAAYPSILILKNIFHRSLLFFSITIPLSFFLFIVCLLLILGILFLFIPKIREGYYPLERKGEVMKWMFCAGIVNYTRLIGIQRIIYSNPLLRRLYFKIFRANVHPSAIIAYNAILVDPYLLEIGEDAKIGDFAKISCHFSNKKKFILKKVIVEKHSIVGANSSIAPGVIIKEKGMLGGESVALPNAIIPKSEVWFGCPAKKISIL